MFTYQNDREAPYLLGLDKRDSLKQLIEGAETAGQHYESLGVLHEHHLADEEIIECYEFVTVDEGIGFLLKGQVYVYSYRFAGTPLWPPCWQPP